MAYHDFERINSIPITDVLEKLCIQVVRGRRALCFMHDDHHPSLSVYKDSNSWFCFTCNKGGGVIDLVKSYFDYDTDQACKWLEVEFNILPKPRGWRWGRDKLPIIKKEKVDSNIEVDSDVLEWIIDNTVLTTQALCFLEKERRIKKAVFEQLRIRAIDNEQLFIKHLLKEFDAQKLLKNHILSESLCGYKLTWDAPCLLFPYYDVSGRLVNIQSRYLNHINGNYPPRFRFIKDSKTGLFNAQILKGLSPGSPLLITEGVTDAMAAISCGINTVAVAGASAFKDEYVELLCDYVLFICPDNDAPGQGLYQDVKKKMSKRLAVVKKLHLADGSKDLGAYFAQHETLRFSK